MGLDTFNLDTIIMLRFLLLFVTVVLGILPYVQAQPEYNPARCHHAHQYAPPVPLTPQQQMRWRASVERSDSFDILHHNINLDVIDFSGQTLRGFCGVKFSPKVNGLSVLPLDLLAFTVDSVTLSGQSLPFSHDGVLLEIDLPMAMQTTDTAEVWVYYHGMPEADPSWGGFKFQNGYAYNLGIGLNSSPYNMGRSWFPCFDNFVERATYEFHIRTQGSNRAYCIGTFLGQDTIGVDTFVRHYEMNQLLPTYLVNTAVTNYAEVNYTHTGTFGTLPVQLVARPADTAAVHSTFSYLGGAIDALEKWYGAYWWERVGYVMTPQGAMEHPTNIAYPQNVGVGGATAAQNRLMTHELAHCWWGNVVTLRTPSDMWIKEGNAEYGAHLFTEHVFGEQDFINEVKANHRLVLRQAHFDDGAYFPLSGIPVENAYGTHTYNKGASMIHNMRAYMGDSLFEVGQNAVLNTYSYSAIDGTTYRDALAAATGLNMNPFFDAWIFGTGFAGYEVNYLTAVLAANQYNVDIGIEQKLRAAMAFHTEVPIEITFVGGNNEKHTVEAEVSGQFSQVLTSCPFRPVYAVLNARNRLNIAVLGEERVATQPTGEQTLPYTDAALTIVATSDTAHLWVEHYWIAPDTTGTANHPIRLSGSHYWRFEGILPTTFHAKVKLEYKANSIPKLDADLLSVTEDSLILVYRRDPSQPWSRYPYFTKNILFNPGDGLGSIRIDSLMLGEYAFANGDMPLLDVPQPAAAKPINIKVFPNPTAGQVFITLSNDLQPTNATIELCDASGKFIWKQKQFLAYGDEQYVLDLSPVPAGLYFLNVRHQDGTLLHTEKLAIK